jgi:hypothetical protein
MRSYNLKEQKAREQRDSLSTDAPGGQLKSAQTSGELEIRAKLYVLLPTHHNLFFFTALFPSFFTIYSCDRKGQGKKGDI